MKPNLNLIRISVFALVCFISCISARAQQQYGTVYLYRGRDTQEANIYNPEAIVFLDGEEFLAMSERTFIGIRFPVGQYELTMKTKGLHQVINVEADKTYYFRISQVAGNYAHQMIYSVEQKTALDAIRLCDAVKEKKIKIKRFDLVRTDPNKKKS
jgi:hypothetical protein